MSKNRKYEVTRVHIKSASFDLLIMELPEDEIEDKLTYLSREKGLVKKSLYDDFIIATCIANINDFLTHLNQKGTDLKKLNEIRAEIVENIIDINKFLDPEKLVINKNKVVKIGKPGDKDVIKLTENEFWDKDTYKETEQQILQNQEKKESLDLNKIRSLKDLEYTPVQKFWKRLGQYVTIKQFSDESADVILGGREFTTRTAFEQYVVTICIEEVEDLFLRLDSLGIPNRVSPPILIHELYELCKSSNPFLDFNNYKGPNIGMDPFSTMHRTAYEGEEDEAMQSKKTKLFKHVKKETLLNLGNSIKKQVIGQDVAIDNLVDAIQRASVGLKEPDHPLGAFIFAGYSGCGKCHGKGTPIRMYDGSIKLVEDIKIGDQLMGDDSTPRNVLSLARGRDVMFEVIPNKGGNSFICNKSHILSLWDSRYKTINEISIEDYLKKDKWFKHFNKLYRTAVKYRENDILVDPYFMGLWLGSGAFDRVAITSADKEIINYIYTYASKLNLEINVDYDKNNKSNIYIITSASKGGSSDKNILLNNMRTYGLISGNEFKFIPKKYLINSILNRKKLLAGLIDSNGYLNGNCYEITSKYSQLANNIVELCRSLGYCACVTDKMVNNKLYYRVNISGDLSDLPIRLNKKRSSSQKQVEDVTVTSFTLKELPVNDYYGFVLDGNSRYLLEDFTVTHNTYTAKILAESLIGSSRGLVNIDCSEYASDHEYAKLIGAPAGYIGHEAGGYLTNAIRKNPFSVVLFDEIEKASDRVHQLLLQIMEESRLTDGKGHTVSFNNAIIIMTSNVGVKEVDDISKTIGFGNVNKITDDKRSKAVNEALKKKFKPEFLNRLTAIINFNTLTKDNYLDIIKLELDKLKVNLKLSETEFSQIKLVFDDSLLDFIYNIGIDDQYGARPLKRAIENEISTPLARKFLNDGISGKASAFLSVVDDELQIDIKTEDDTSDPPFYMKVSDEDDADK